MLDINNTLDLIKLKFYNEWLYTAHVYDEGDSGFHKSLTTQVVEKYIDPLELPKDATILDMGCGPGYFLDNMKARGYTNTLGLTLSEGDIKICQEKGHKIKQYDMSFIPQIDGWHDESVDMIFCRHAIEHSPYPIFTLAEYNRLLKQGSKLYIEVPAPNTERKHEYNLNHYSVFDIAMWDALLSRCGFNIDLCNTFEFPLKYPVIDDQPEHTVQEKFLIFIATKKRPLDIK